MRKFIGHPDLKIKMFSGNGGPDQVGLSGGILPCPQAPPRQFLNLGSRKCHFLRFSQDIFSK